MQIARFSHGGFVVHKIQWHGKRYKLSAWFSERGDLLDAEYVHARKVSSVPVNHSEVRGRLEEIGRRIANSLPRTA